MTVAKVVRKVSIKDQSSDFRFWQTQSYQVRLATLEQLRQEYHQWKYGTQPGFQRVFRIIKQQSG